MTSLLSFWAHARSFLVLSALLITSSTIWAQTLKVLSAGAFKQVVVALVPVIEAQTGMSVQIDNDTAGALASRIRAGESFDVVVLPPNGLATLAQEGGVDPDSIKNIAQVGIGVAVRSGEARPTLTTVEQFKEAVLKARRIAYIDPASGGSSGIYLNGLFQRMGIAAQVSAKAVLVPGGLVAERLVTGEADLAIHQVSEILPVRGVDLVGTLPEEIQNYTRYAGAISTQSRYASAARTLLQTLASPEAIAVIKAKGMAAAP